LVATFAGRMYGIRSKEAKRRLLVQAQQKVSGDDRSTGSATSVALTATASCAAFCGQDELSSDALKRAALAERVEWLAEIAAEVTRKLIAEHFNDADIKRLGSGVGPDDRPLPAKGYAAMRRLGWTATSDVHCSDRVHRMGEEAAARLLRQADHRRQLVAGIIATWPKDPQQR
ncbi:transposase, partial [mine drainage metagenome]